MIIKLYNIVTVNSSNIDIVLPFWYTVFVVYERKIENESSNF